MAQHPVGVGAQQCGVFICCETRPGILVFVFIGLFVVRLCVSCTPLPLFIPTRHSLSDSVLFYLLIII